MSSLKEYLHNQGVEHVYFCSGSRNKSLLAEFEGFKVFHRFDERSASFEALGDTKITQKPVVVCTTSGTAVAECLPAIIEAYYSYQKLIIITADRPKRLRHSFAPQSINQINIYSSFLRTHYSGTLGNFNLRTYNYPIQLNIEIDDTDIVYENEISTLSLEEYESKLKHTKQPIILITRDHGLSKDQLAMLCSFKCYFYIEAISNIDIDISNDLEIKEEKNLLELFYTQKSNAIIKIGATPVTKLWRELERSLEGINVFCDDRFETGLSYGFKVSVDSFLSCPLEYNLSKIAESGIELLLQEYKKSEVNIVNSILSSLKTNSHIYIGNSMPIRYIELLKQRKFQYLCSRGANGIDGQIATAIGIARNTDDEVHALLGDLTFIYDFNNIFFIPHNLTIHVLDNNGGRIFERVSANKDIINAHNLSLEIIIEKLDLSNKVIIHKIDNEQTNNFWKEYLR